MSGHRSCLCISTDECTVILGDMIEVWTNGHLKATRVRAVRETEVTGDSLASFAETARTHRASDSLFPEDITRACFSPACAQHRVALVPWQRTSLIRFVGLDNDALVQPLPQFGEPRYRPRTQAEHLDAMMDEAEKQRDEVKAATAGGGSK